MPRLPIKAKTTRHSPSLCPECGTLLDASTALSDPSAAPGAGDITLCIECGTVLEYDARLRVQRTTPTIEAEVFREQPRIKRLAQRIRAERKAKPKAGQA